MEIATNIAIKIVGKVITIHIAFKKRIKEILPKIKQRRLRAIALKGIMKEKENCTI